MDIWTTVRVCASVCVCLRVCVCACYCCHLIIQFVGICRWCFHRVAISARIWLFWPVKKKKKKEEEEKEKKPTHIKPIKGKLCLWIVVTKTPDNVAFAFLLFQFPSEVRFRRFCDSTADSSVCVCVAVCVCVCVCVTVISADCFKWEFVWNWCDSRGRLVDCYWGDSYWIAAMAHSKFYSCLFLSIFLHFSSIFPPFFLHFSFPPPPSLFFGKIVGGFFALIVWQLFRKWRCLLPPHLHIRLTADCGERERKDSWKWFEYFRGSIWLVAGEWQHCCPPHRENFPFFFFSPRMKNGWNWIFYQWNGKKHFRAVFQVVARYFWRPCGSLWFVNLINIFGGGRGAFWLNFCCFYPVTPFGFFRSLVGAGAVPRPKTRADSPDG